MKLTVQLTLACLMSVGVIAQSKPAAATMARAGDIENAPGARRYPGLPKCATGCFNETVLTNGCDVIDAKCHCAHPDNFQASFETCVVRLCSPSEQEVYAHTLIDYCYTSGVSFKGIKGVTIMMGDAGVLTTNHQYPNIPPPSVAPRSEPGLPYAFSDQSFPACSKKCVVDSFTVDGCAYDDVACHCANTAAREASFNDCVTKACGPPCQSKYQDAYEATCKTATGVIVPRLPQTPVDQFEAPGSPKCPFNAYPPVPECSQRCFNATVFTDGCCLADAACHCSKHAAFQESFNHCVVNDCPKRSQQKAYIKALTDSCHSVCVNVPAGAQLTLPPRPSGSHHAKPGRVRRDTAAIISSAVASGHSAIVSSILGGLGPIVSNITAINPTALTTKAANQTSAAASRASGIAPSANASTTTLTTTGSDVAATATLTATAVASISGNSSISTSLSSGIAGLSSEPAGILAQIVLGMTCWIVLLV